MRLPIAVLALAAVATPAAAQNMRSTTRIDTETLENSTNCSVAAYPEVRLTAAAKGYRMADWEIASVEDANTPVRLTWEPAANWRAPHFRSIGFTVPGDATLRNSEVTGVNVIVDDGKPVLLPFFEDGSSKLHFGVSTSDIDDVGARIIASHRVVLEILNSAGKTLRRYSWDTHRLADAVRTISVADWNCH